MTPFSWFREFAPPFHTFKKHQFFAKRVHFFVGRGGWGWGCGNFKESIKAPPWWHHQVETLSALLAFCEGNSPVTGEFHSQRPVNRSLVNSTHKCQWCGALIFSLITWTNGWVNNRDAGDLRRHRTPYDVTVMITSTGRPTGLGKKNPVRVGTRISLSMDYGDVKWPSWRLELPANRLFIQQFVQYYKKEA